jgi:hypothetical protein
MKPVHSLNLAVLVALVAFLSCSSGTLAQVVDVTAAGSSGSINGALFFNTDQQPAGTGFIQSFLRVQNKGFEQGYNSDGGFPFDDKNPHNFQHSILLSDLSTFTLNGTAYYKFMLDSNQSGNSGHSFTLDRFQIYTSSDPSITSETFSTDGTGLRTLPLGHLAYTMNNNDGTGGYVLTTATGSGKYDMFTYVPVSDFNPSDKYVYLYMAGGDNLQANGGFEEWTAATNVAQVPEPNITALIIVSCGAFTLLRRRGPRSNRP